MTPEDNRKKGLFPTARALLFPTCREMSRHSSRCLDEPLPFFQRFGVILHLVFCRLCRRYRRQIRWLGTAAGRPAASAPGSPRLSEACRERLKQSLRRQISGAAPAAFNPTPTGQPNEHGHDSHR
jgi:hypothetical protein